ncbi:MAG: LamG-like jellyroll fold domain-containing protein [Balneolaceae bacterium]|nr:LamG-like jellyroll fold domain-containing protein [Balneolaceae bacterium]
MSLNAKFWMVTLLFVLAVSRAETQNLISVPGCESNISTAWSNSGNWICDDPSSFGFADPPEGSNAFVTDAQGDFELYQDIDVSGNAANIDAGTQEYDFSGQINTSSNHSARFIVEYRSSSGSVLGSYDSGKQRSSSQSDWKTLSDTRVAPAGTRTVRIRLLASNDNNGGYANAFFDALSFTEGGIAATAPTATTDTASDIRPASATLNGAVDPGGASTSVVFEYGTTTSYGNSVTADQSPVTGLTSTNVSVSVSGLSEGTTYHYRVKATNSEGTDYGADQTFTTLAPGDNLLRNPGCEQITETPDHWTESATDWECYDISSVVSPRNGAAFGDNSSSPNSPLEMYQDVDISYNSGDIDAGSAAYQFTGYLQTKNGDLGRVILEYRDGSNSVLETLDTGQQTSEGSWKQLSLKGNSPAGARTVRIRVITTEGNGGGSTGYIDAFFDDLQLSETAAASAPTAATGSPTLIRPDGATLNGTADANGASTTVTFQYGTDTSYGNSVTADQSPLSGTLNTPVSAEITGLSEGTTYHYRTVAQNSEGTNYGSDQAFTTLAPGDNLLLNAGCDGEDSTPDHWTELQPDWHCLDVSSVITPLSGAALGDNSSSDNSPIGIQQEVDLSFDQLDIDAGTVAYELAGNLQTLNSDAAKIILQFIDGSNNVLGSIDTGEITSEGSWQTIVLTANAPASTRSARVRFIGLEKNGGGSAGYIDAFFDEFSLKETGAIQARNYPGSSMQFDGVNDYAAIPHQPALDLTSKLTVEFWIKSSVIDNRVVLEKSRDNSHYHVQIVSGSSYGGDRKLLFGVSSSLSNGRALSQSEVFDGNWHHVAATYDDASDLIQIYMDGLLETENSNATDTPVSNSLDLVF